MTKMTLCKQKFGLLKNGIVTALESGG